MKKMVTDNPQDNVEIMLNLAYGKDGEVWIRGGSEEGEDCTLVDFAKRTCKACKCYLADDVAEQGIDEEDARVLEMVQGKPLIKVINKADILKI